MPASYRRALAVPSFRRLLVAHAAATLGQLQLTMAVAVDVHARTGSGLGAATAIAVGFAPYLVCSYPAGMIADRYPRATVLGWSVAGRLVTAGITAAGLLLGWPVSLLVVLTAVTAVLATPAYPALAAATPQLVPDRDLAAANSLVTGVENIAWVSGPGVLGIVLLTGAPVWGGALAATVCFALGVAVLGRAVLDRPVGTVPAPARSGAGPGTVPGTAPGGWPGSAGASPGAAHVAPVAQPPFTLTAAPASAWAQARAGVDAVLADRPVRATFGLALMDNFLYGYLVVALVLLGAEVLAAGDSGVGALTTAFGLGALASLAVNQRLADTGRERRVLGLGMLGFAAATGGLGAAGTLQVAVVLIALAGLLTLATEVTAVTLIQRITAAGLTARVIGLYDAASVGVIALGSLVAGALSDAAGVRPGLVIVAATTAALTAIVVRGIRPT